MHLIEKIAVVVGIFGGIVGFISALYPIIKSRVNLKVVLPKRKATVYYEEVEYEEFDIENLKPYNAFRFDTYFSADIGILNLSSNKQVVYALSLLFRHKDGKLSSFDLRNSNFSGYYTKEKPCELPIEIDANSAHLCSVSFFLDQIDNLDQSEFEAESFQIVAYCQNKEFILQVYNIDYKLEIL